MLNELGVDYELRRENPWEKREAFGQLNFVRQTPVLNDLHQGIILADSRAICEYFEETLGRSSLTSGTPLHRAEIRRLIAWFDECFYDEVTAPLLFERLIKRLLLNQPPDSRAIRTALRKANDWLYEIDYLIDTRPWLAGATKSLADLAAAAQISVVEYLGGCDWSGHEQARTWYSVLKSRSAFQPLLSDRIDGIVPPANYLTVDWE